MVKNPPANAGDTREAGSIPGSGRSPGVGKGTSLQYPCLENSMGRGAWWATVHGAAKSRMQLGTVQGTARRDTRVSAPSKKRSCRYTVKQQHLRASRRRPHNAPYLPRTLILKFAASRTVRNKFLLLTLLGLWYIAMAAQADKY